MKQSAARLRGIPAELIETLAWHADPRFFSQALHGLGTMYENRARMRISLLIAVSEPIIVVTIGLIFLFAVVGLFAFVAIDERFVLSFPGPVFWSLRYPPCILSC
ncbi:MAG: hypothetical protein R3C12_03580 [Planctomycetaceae bacterium]